MCEKSSVMRSIEACRETVWINPDLLNFSESVKDAPFSMEDIIDASKRLDRFSDYFIVAFPETAASNGIIESPLRRIPSMKKSLETKSKTDVCGDLWIKLDSHLPVSGSIKARGGIYEVLKHAEDLALEQGLLKEDMLYREFNSGKFKDFFSNYSIAVGSTRNLGLSIGIISAKMGFHVTVHMSADARQWKKDLLREKGVTVVEYESDYSAAVAQGRQEAETDPTCYFIDDENSKTLFLGYSVAALRLKKQMTENALSFDEEHPLFVYLPCGVGGGPGGVAFGLKQVYGDSVHCFFAEPTHSCCMMLGMASGLNSKISVQDIGIDNHTIADGLAVGRASSFVGTVMKPFLSGCYSIDDERMLAYLTMLADSENIFLEPSALAGMFGPVLASYNDEMEQYINNHNISKSNITHLVWATGGSMVPKDEMKKYYEKGKCFIDTNNMRKQYC